MFVSEGTKTAADSRKGLEVEVLVRAAAERVARSSSLEFVDLEVRRGGKGPLVRIYLDKPDRITLDELESASREISAILDVEDPIGRSYTLEVSSPGMTRPLKTPRDFERALEKNIHIAYVETGSDPTPSPDVSPVHGTAEREERPAAVKEVKGRLVAVSEREVRIVPRDPKGREGAEVAVPLAALRHAQREISFR